MPIDGQSPFPDFDECVKSFRVHPLWKKIVAEEKRNMLLHERISVLSGEERDFVVEELENQASDTLYLASAEVLRQHAITESVGNRAMISVSIRYFAQNEFLSKRNKG